jgi:hypothetical protein
MGERMLWGEIYRSVRFKEEFKRKKSGRLLQQKAISPTHPVNVFFIVSAIIN